MCCPNFVAGVFNTKSTLEVKLESRRQETVVILTSFKKSWNVGGQVVDQRLTIEGSIRRDREGTETLRQSEGMH